MSCAKRTVVMSSKARISRDCLPFAKGNDDTEGLAMTTRYDTSTMTDWTHVAHAVQHGLQHNSNPLQ
jgi:hypothetical protein